MLVLDDVDDVETFDKIIGMQGSFYPGSKIIIITSTRQRSKLVTAKGAYKVHEVKGLGWMDSLKLFCRHAFGQDHPKENFEHFSRKIAKHCEGHPLALKVLGKASLDWGSAKVWTDQIKALEDTPNGEIMNKLKISFETIDAHVQNLFLDIACFFIGEDKDFIVMLLDECEGFSPTSGGMQTLASRYLITIDELSNNRPIGAIGMHNLIRDMGRDIVRRKSLNDCGVRSRLWKSKDSYGVLTRKTGTRTVQGIVLHKYDLSVDKVVLEEDTFRYMVELQLLMVSDVELTGSYDSKLNILLRGESYKSFPKGLRLLRWRRFPLCYIPEDIVLESLVVLEMPYSNLRRVWKIPKRLPQLKILDLSHSQNLTDTPDFSLIPKLETLILKGCANLMNIHESIVSLENLQTLDISGCSNLSQFSRSKLNMVGALKVFFAEGTRINRWFSYMEKVKSFHNFWPKSSLEKLCLNDNKLFDDHFPDNAFKSTCNLSFLDLSGNQISRLPDCVGDLTGLTYLCLDRCDKLSIVELPKKLSVLEVSQCHLLKKITLKSASCRPGKVNAANCNEIVEFEHWFKLEPPGSIDVEMIKILGLDNLLESVQHIKINITSSLWSRMLPIQGIREDRIYNVFLPGNEIPSTYDHKSYDPCKPFKLPNKKRIHGLNMSVVYAARPYWERFAFIDFKFIPIGICIICKGVMWFYCPSFFGSHVDSGKDMTWFSHWNLRYHLDGGDVVTVLASLNQPQMFDFKELGVQIVYEEEEEMTSIQSEITMHYPTVVRPLRRQYSSKYRGVGRRDEDIAKEGFYLANPWADEEEVRDYVDIPKDEKKKRRFVKFATLGAHRFSEVGAPIPEGYFLENRRMDEEEKTDDEAPRKRREIGECSNSKCA